MKRQALFLALAAALLSGCANVPRPVVPDDGDSSRILFPRVPPTKCAPCGIPGQRDPI